MTIAERVAEMVTVMREHGIGVLTVGDIAVDLTDIPVPVLPKPPGLDVIRDEDGELVVQTRTEPAPPRGRIFKTVPVRRGEADE